MTITVPANEPQTLRVFAADLPKDDIARFQSQPNHIATLLGVPTIDPAQIALFHTDDLADIGLVDYLLDGGGVTEAQLAPDRLTLAAYRGYVLTLRDAAFPTSPCTPTLACAGSAPTPKKLPPCGSKTCPMQRQRG
jgi:hypothetical protein